MNFFVEGLQGSGKSTLVGRLIEKYPDHKAFREGDYSPVELAWCAYLTPDQYAGILDKYSEIRPMIEDKTTVEAGCAASAGTQLSADERFIVCYTQIITDIPGFHKDLEQYEIYNGRTALDDFKSIVLGRYRRWNGDNSIFECSLFQNTVEDMILFRVMPDDEIIDFYREVRKALEGKDYHIYYLEADDVEDNINVIRKERSDDEGNELWFPLMIGYFNESPYAAHYGVSGEDELIRHLKHRQELELRICREVFSDRYTVLKSKKYEEI
ncbi:signal recognition particle subunit FFH/SRP54 (srp54) [Lachnospiraceae bacterium XBB2008]|nr:signal recognition particle subunit FFH/SRP54 (srp54) [Lachnospiraceae bacterium XBB2008]